jgi:hypothetical protein
MKHALSVARIFNFNVEPIFQVYNDVAILHEVPRLESVLDNYDALIERRVKDIQYEIGTPDGKPWTIDKVDDEFRSYVERVIDMKIYLESRELIEVFHNFHMMYVDNYGIYHNMPTKDVW